MNLKNLKFFDKFDEDLFFRQAHEFKFSRKLCRQLEQEYEQKFGKEERERL